MSNAHKCIIGVRLTAMLIGAALIGAFLSGQIPVWIDGHPPPHASPTAFVVATLAAPFGAWLIWLGGWYQLATTTNDDTSIEGTR
jgi:hypothetical protein